MPKVKICDPSALGKGKSSTKPQMNNRKKKQLEDKIIELFGICLTFAEVKKVIGLQDYTCAMNWIQSEGIEPVLSMGGNGTLPQTWPRRWSCPKSGRCDMSQIIKRTLVGVAAPTRAGRKRKALMCHY